MESPQPGSYDHPSSFRQRQSYGPPPQRVWPWALAALAVVAVVVAGAFVLNQRSKHTAPAAASPASVNENSVTQPNDPTDSPSVSSTAASEESSATRATTSRAKGTAVTTGAKQTGADAATTSLSRRFFNTASSWNTPIPAGARYVNIGMPPNKGGTYWVNWEAYSPAVVRGKPSDPLVRMNIKSSWGWPAQTLQIHIPENVTGANGNDGELLVIDGSTVHNFWQFKRTSRTSASCSAYGRTDIRTGTGWGTRKPHRSAGIVATGSSQLAGLLVESETDAGEIHHALQLAMLERLVKPGAKGEALDSDGHSASGIVHEGERLALPRSYQIPAGLSPLGKKVARALQKYGAFVIDKGGANTLRAQANAYDKATIAALRADMQQVLPKLQWVDF